MDLYGHVAPPVKIHGFTDIREFIQILAMCLNIVQEYETKQARELPAGTICGLGLKDQGWIDQS
jgi:hypothetical protein